MRPTLVRWCERTEAVRPPPTRFAIGFHLFCCLNLHICPYVREITDGVCDEEDDSK
jgi:hypothetical protein